MDIKSFKSNNRQTQYIQLNTQNCKACWKCLTGCPQKVIGKVDIIIHKHVLIKNSDKCNGCLKCVKVCEFEAINKIAE